MRKKKTTATVETKESPDFNSEHYTYHPIMFINWKQQKNWVIGQALYF